MLVRSTEYKADQLDADDIAAARKFADWILAQVQIAATQHAEVRAKATEANLQWLYAQVIAFLTTLSRDFETGQRVRLSRLLGRDDADFTVHLTGNTPRSGLVNHLIDEFIGYLMHTSSIDSRESKVGTGADLFQRVRGGVTKDLRAILLHDAREAKYGAKDQDEKSHAVHSKTHKNPSASLLPQPNSSGFRNIFKFPQKKVETKIIPTVSAMPAPGIQPRAEVTVPVIDAEKIQLPVLIAKLEETKNTLAAVEKEYSGFSDQLRQNATQVKAAVAEQKAHNAVTTFKYGDEALKLANDKDQLTIYEQKLAEAKATAAAVDAPVQQEIDAQSAQASAMVKTIDRGLVDLVAQSDSAVRVVREVVLGKAPLAPMKQDEKLQAKVEKEGAKKLTSEEQAKYLRTQQRYLLRSGPVDISAVAPDESAKVAYVLQNQEILDYYREQKARIDADEAFARSLQDEINSHNPRNH